MKKPYLKNRPDYRRIIGGSAGIQLQAECELIWCGQYVLDRPMHTYRAAELMHDCIVENAPLAREFDGATRPHDIGVRVLEWCCLDDRQFIDQFPDERLGTEDDPYFMLIVRRRMRIGDISEALIELLNKST